MSRKLVVLFGAVGPFEKGSVVKEECFAPEERERLQRIGAVREAESAEADQPKVKLADRSLSTVSYEVKLADKDRQIADLTVRCAQLEREVSVLKSHVVGPDPKLHQPSAPAVELLAEKERQIAALKAERDNAKKK